MKRTILSVTLLVSMALVSFSSAQGRYYKDGGRRNMPKEMQLTDDQKKKMDEINDSFSKKFDEVRDSKLTATERKDKMSALRTEKRDAMDKVFTKEQKEYYGNNRGWRNDRNRGDRYYNNNRGRGYDRGQGCCADGRGFNDRGRNFDRGYGCDYGYGRGMGRGGDACYYLENVGIDLTDAQKEQVKKLWEKNEGDRTQMRDKHREEMKKILTPEQLKKLDERRNRK